MFAITIRERSGQVYTFHFDKPEVLIGRVKGNDVILPKQNISKRHALIRVNGPRFIIEDFGSTNGTYVNGHRITGAVEIGADDKVYLGDFVMNFVDLASSDLDSAPDLPSHMGGVATGDGPVTNDSVEPGATHLAGLESANGLGAGNTGSARRSSRSPMEDGEDAGATRFDAIDEGQLAARLAEGSDAVDVPAGHSPTLIGGPDFSGLSDEEFLASLGAEAPPPVPGVPDLPELPELPDLAASGDSAAPPPTGKGKKAVGKAEAQSPAPEASPAPVHESTRSYGQGKAADLASADSGRRAIPPLGPLPRMTGPLVPLPAFELGSRVPTTPGMVIPGVAPNPQYFDDLASLYRGAMRDLRPAVPLDASAMTDAEWAEMEDRVVAFVDNADRRGELAPDTDVAQLKRDLIYELAGLGPLEPMLDDPSVESIEVNHAAQILVIRNGRRESVYERFSCQVALAAAVDRLVRATGLQRPPHEQHVEGTLVDGTTVRVVWPPLCPTGPTVLLRKPRAHAPSVEELVERGNITPHAAACLKYLVRSQRSIAICGWAHAGRRTVMNALALLIGKEARLVVTEDGRRLRLPHEHLVRLDAAAHSGDTPILDIARKLMPDWLLIGEGAGVDFAALVAAANDEGLPPWIATFYTGPRNTGFLRHAVNALCVRHPGVSAEVGAARIAGAFEGVASFSWVDGKAVLDRVELVGYGADQLDLTPITWDDLPDDLRPARP